MYTCHTTFSRNLEEPSKVKASLWYWMTLPIISTASIAPSLQSTGHISQWLLEVERLSAPSTTKRRSLISEENSSHIPHTEMAYCCWAIEIILWFLMIFIIPITLNNYGCFPSTLNYHTPSKSIREYTLGHTQQLGHSFPVDRFLLLHLQHLLVQVFYSRNSLNPLSQMYS